MNPGDVAPVVVSLTITIAVALVVILRGPVGRALGRRIEGVKAPDESHTLAAVDDMQARVAQLEQQIDRMHELEERLDFAERLLARQADTGRLPPG